MRLTFMTTAVLAICLSTSAQTVVDCQPLEPCTTTQKALLNQFRAYIAPSSYPDRWVLIQLQDEQLVAFDTRSVSRIAPNVYRVWLRTEKQQWIERWHDKDGEHDKRADAMMMQEDFDCARRQTRAVKIAAYLSRTVVWGPTDLNEGWQSILPESSEEYWYPQVCKNITGILPDH